MKTKKLPPDPSNDFVCQCGAECAGGKAFAAHLESMHQVTERKGRKSLLSHIDFDDHYIFQYEWEVGGIKAVQTTVNPRTRATAFPWQEGGE